MKFSAATDIGKVRETNEDAFFISGNGVVFVVADGMGGHLCGEVASRLAVTTVEKYSQSLSVCPEEEIVDNLNHIAHDVFFLISAKVSEDDACTKMGTTIVVAVVRNNKLFYAHLGDSRLYLLRNGVLSRVTHDHSVVQELVDAKVITEVEALSHPMRNMVTRVLADGSEYVPDVNSIDLHSGDKLLLCTDGLCGAVEDNVIKNELKKKLSPDEINKLLINIALATGGNDNVTVITIENDVIITHEKKVIEEIKPASHWKNGFIAMMSALLLFLVVYVIAGLIFKKFIVKVNPDTRTLSIFEYHPLIPFMPNKVVEGSIIKETDVNKIVEYRSINFIQGKTINSIEDGEALLRKMDESIKSEAVNNQKVDKKNGDNKEPNAEPSKK